jgi:hypothetical protein
MKEPLQKRQGKRIGLRIVSMLLLTVLSVSLLLGTTFARYQISAEQNITLTYPQKQGQTICLLPVTQTSDDESTPQLQWQKDEDNRYFLQFCLTNGPDSEQFCSDDQTVAICVIATEGVVPDNVVLTLNEEYTAVPEKIEEGTLLYDSYGAGWVYHFYQDDEEVRWVMPGNAYFNQQFTLTVTGGSSNPAALTLIAEER